MASFFGNVAGINKGTQQSTFTMSSINGTVVIDGVTYVGKRIRVMNDKVFVDDKEVSGLGTDPTRPVNVVIKERVESIEGDFNTITAKDVRGRRQGQGQRHRQHLHAVGRRHRQGQRGRQCEHHVWEHRRRRPSAWQRDVNVWIGQMRKEINKTSKTSTKNKAKH